MSSGADLFVVCRHCGSEVSPYVTECPYCGQRLRRRAPKLPRERRSAKQRRPRLFDRSASLRSLAGAALTRPYATIGLVLCACGLWVATTSGFVDQTSLSLEGPIHGEWWRLASSQFVYISGVYAFVAVLAIAVFGWLLERRHGPLFVLAIFFAAGISGALVAEAVSAQPLMRGGNAAALGLVAAWAARDLAAAKRREWYDGDLLGAAAVASALLAMPLAKPEANWLAGIVGGLLGLLVGFGFSRIASISEL